MHFPTTYRWMGMVACAAGVMEYLILSCEKKRSLIVGQGLDIVNLDLEIVSSYIY
jgi:hypothetical protein